MKFKSQVMTQASGSIGGITYGHNKGGLYQRARAIPVNPNTSRQVNARQGMTVLASQYGDLLTPAQRDSWDLYASNVQLTDVFGDPLQVSGQNMFIRSNQIALQAAAEIGSGLGAIPDAPTTFNLGDPGSFDTFVVSEAAGLSVAITGTPPWTNEPGAAAIVFVGRPQSPGRNYFKGPYRLAAIELGDVTTPPAGIIIAPGAMPFVATQGQKVSAYIRVRQTDGRLSGKINLGPVIVGA